MAISNQVIDQRLVTLKESVDAINKKLDTGYVMRNEFEALKREIDLEYGPVKKGFYAIIALTGAGVLSLLGTMIVWYMKQPIFIGGIPH